MVIAIEDGGSEAVEAQLTAAMHQHLSSFRDTFTALELSESTGRAAVENMRDLSAMCHQTAQLFDNFGAIQLLSRTYRNFAETNRTYERFSRLNSQVERCAQLIEADAAAVAQGDCPRNVLLALYLLDELARFERETMALVAPPPQSLSQSSPQLSPNSSLPRSPINANTMASQLRKYFRRLDELRSAFEAYFWQLPRRMLADAAKGDRQWLIVNVAKAIARSADPAAFKGRLRREWQDFVRDKFVSSLASAQAGNDVQDTLKGVGFWSDDLAIVRDGIVPCFPPVFDVLDTMALLYHRHLHDIMQHLGSRTRLTPGDILHLLCWLRTYYGEMSGKFGLTEAMLEPRMLQDREAVLTRLYLDQSRDKIATWTSNLLATEVKAFVAREQSPDLDAEDQYLTPAAVDLYQIVKQNVDTALASRTPFLVAAVIDAAVGSVKDFQRGLSKALQSECARFCDKAPNMAGHFEEYVMMLGNSGLCWVRFMEELAAKLDSDAADLKTPEGTTGTLSQSIKALRDSNEGFVQLAKDSVDVLVRIILMSVQPAYNQLFLANAPSDLVESICATFEDFLQDYAQHYNPFLMKRLAAQLLESHICTYVESMRVKGARIAPATDGVGRMTQENLQVSQFFIVGGWRDEMRVEKAMEPLKHLLAVLEAPPQLVFMESSSLFQQCPDLSPHVLEELLSKRTDLDKASLRDLSESLHAKAKEQRQAAPDISTILGKLKRLSSK